MESDQHPAIGLPDNVEGFIDLKTLDRIYCALCQSKDPEDPKLATWIKQNYLYEPIGEREEGRPIRNREGFEKLDRAYKRVRLLTNKAQDKWPFFDRTWKKMSATTVRKVALREADSPGVQITQEAVPGTSFPVQEFMHVKVDNKGEVSSEISRTIADIEPIKPNSEHPSTPDKLRKRDRERNDDGTFSVGPRKKGRQGSGIGTGGHVRSSTPSTIKSEDDGSLLRKNDCNLPHMNGNRDGLNGSDRTRTPSSASSDLSIRLAKGGSDIPNTQHTFQEAIDTGLGRSTIGINPEILHSNATLDGSQQQTPAHIYTASTDRGKKATRPAYEWSAQELLRLGVAMTSGHQSSADAAQDKATFTLNGMKVSDQTSRNQDIAHAAPGVIQSLKSSPTAKFETAKPMNGNVTQNATATNTIQFLARVNTDTGPIEVLVPPDSFSDMEKLTSCIRMYISWKNGIGSRSDVTFEQFSSIYTLK